MKGMWQCEFWGISVQEQLQGGWKDEEERTACRLFSSPRFFVFNSCYFPLLQKKKLPNSFPAGMDVDKFLLSLHYDE